MGAVRQVKLLEHKPSAQRPAGEQAVADEKVVGHASTMSDEDTQIKQKIVRNPITVGD